MMSGTCNNGIIELTPVQTDGDAVVRVTVNEQTNLFATVIYTDSQGAMHRKIAQTFKSGVVFVSARGAKNQPIGPTLKITCP